MKSRSLPIAVGSRGWIQETHTPLPAGLEERTEVTAKALDQPQVIVTDSNGAEWTVFHWQVDWGFEYCGPAGNWMHESRRQVLDAIEGVLTKQLAHTTREGIGGVSDACYISKCRWILERNGRKVSE